MCEHSTAIPSQAEKVSVGVPGGELDRSGSMKCSCSHDPSLFTRNLVGRANVGPGLRSGRDQFEGRLLTPGLAAHLDDL